MATTAIHSATVADVLHPYDTVSPDMPLADAAALMRDHHGRALVVETGDESPAIFTEHDIIKIVGAGDSLDGKTVGDFHTPAAVAATPEWTLTRAVETMKTGRFRHLVVVEDGRTVGLIGMREILLALFEEPEEHPEPSADTVEFGTQVREDAGHLLHNLRRGAKQHMVAAKCFCELDWIEVVIGQAEERPDLTADELREMWNQRPPCPILNAMGGGGD